MTKNKNWTKLALQALSIFLLLILLPVSARAEELSSVSTQKKDDAIISVLMPVLGESRPFDFLIDPNGFLYNTFGDGEEGISVEQGAPLLFMNRAGGMKGLSANSDLLTITNRSTIPIRVLLSAKLECPVGISLREDRNFREDEECSLYLALVDDRGNEMPLTAEKEALLSMELNQAPAHAYAYVSDEEGKFVYAYEQAPEAFLFDSYSFGLIGDCNVNADWSAISAKPEVFVSWSFEPITEEETDTETDTEETPEERPVIGEEEMAEIEAGGDEEMAEGNESGEEAEPDTALGNSSQDESIEDVSVKDDDIT